MSSPSQATALDSAARPRRKGELTAERILDAAEDLFAAKGYAATTLRDVAGSVGLRIPSLYNHFESKESLYAAVLERGIRPVLEALTDFTAAGGSGREDSRAVVQRVMELLAQHPQLARLVQQESLTGGPRLAPLLREWLVRVFAEARQSIDRAGETRWSDDQLPLLVLALYHVVVGYFTSAPLYRELTGEDLLTEEAIERQTRFFGDLVDTIFEGPSS